MSTSEQHRKASSAHSSLNRAPRDPLFALARAILFELDPERAHDLALSMMARPWISGQLTRRYAVPDSDAGQPVKWLGLSLANHIGLAAGLDKNGDYISSLGALGFGHIEIGTVTPKPQSGNPRPRLFRLPEQGALINRMGFNNLGVDHLVRQVERRQYRGCIGINIGKNANTPIKDANLDYLHCLDRVYPVADYVTINISSPNTANLRDLQHGEALTRLLSAITERRSTLATRHQRRVPIAIKIAPDMDDRHLDTFCEPLLAYDIDAVIVGNTTQDRSTVANHLYAPEAGGLSGAPLNALADDRLRAVAARLQGQVSLIGVGGVSTGADAARKRSLGADLVQLYSGLIFHGPALVRDCILATRPE